MTNFKLIIFVFLLFSCHNNVQLQQHLPKEQALNQDILCLNFLPSCLNKKRLIVTRKPRFIIISETHIMYEFENQINLEQLKITLRKYNLPQKKQRQLLQTLFTSLNQKHVNDIKDQLISLTNNHIIDSYKQLAINNSIIIETHLKHQEFLNNFLFSNKKGNQKKFSNNILQGKKKLTVINNNNKQIFSNLGIHELWRKGMKGEGITVALIDSGVSINHQALEHLTKLKQFNPATNSYEIKDSGLGHGSGVLSLLAATSQKGLDIGTLPDANYLVCNGLPLGKYQYAWIISCFDWLFLQEQVDIIVNPWLQPEHHCNDEMSYSLQVVWLANSIPIFSAGNYGATDSPTRSPANLNLYDDIPLLSVGAISPTNSQRLPDSSFGPSSCNSNKIYPTLVAPGSNIYTAHPIQRDSYQIVSGTSYAVTYVATALAMLKQKYPQVPNKKLIAALIHTARDLGTKGPDNQYGFGEINIIQALDYLASELNIAPK